VSPELRRIEISLAQCGDRVVVMEPSNIYGASICDDVFIGPFCVVQEEVTIGPRTKIQSHSFICTYVTIGSDCFIGHGVMFINDKLITGPAGGNRSAWEPTRIGDRVSIGSNSTILPVVICDDVVIGAGSVVTSSIIESGVYAGNPARRIHHDPNG
jgi:acetyltransferase-like isoleucine patch superfamily enzyme